MFSRIRFLPLMIFAAALMLTFKVSNIWEGMEGYIDVGSAVAQTADDEQPTSLSLPSEGEAGAIVEETFDPESFDSDGFLLEDDIAEVEAERMLKRDPTLLSQAEIELLQRLATRRDELDVREAELEQRNTMLRAAEERINNKIGQLKQFQDTIDELIIKYDAQQEQKMQSLVKIYENMKPKDAARIFEELDMDTLLSVAERMKERKLSDIMSKMPPDKARSVTVELSHLRVLPEADTSNGG
jgi:flagellar motility protein MotE (MotC chaperone)